MIPPPAGPLVSALAPSVAPTLRTETHVWIAVTQPHLAIFSIKADHDVQAVEFDDGQDRHHPATVS